LLRKLSQQAELPATPQLYYIPSQIANAFAVGAGERGAIAATDALLRNFSLREVQGVLAHELSHLSSKDGWVMSLADSMSQMVNIMSWIGQILLLINLPLFLMGPYQIPWLLVILLMLAPTISALLQLGLSRTREFQADLEAVRLTGDPRGLASGLAKLERLSGTWFERILMPGRRVPEPSLLRTHPPTEERINRLLKLEQDLLREHPDEHEDWLGEWLRGRGPISTQPRWHVSRFWY
jgi:heat shock protein HtpX